MKIYETLFKDSGLTQIDISKELSMTQQNVSKKKQNMPSIKALSIAMQKLNINSLNITDCITVVL